MAVQNADEQIALGSMWETHREAIRRLLLSLTCDIDLTDDLLQETYLCASAGFSTYRGGNPRAWLATIARNAYRTHARRRYVHTEVPLDAREEIGDSLLPAYDTHELLAIRQALSALSPAFQTALIMKHYAGYTYQEIAHHQHCPVGTAKWRVSKALDRLRQVLLPERRGEMAENVEMHGINLVDYAYGVLGAEEAAAVRTHLATCACCRREAEELQRVVSLLNALEGERRQMHFIELDQQGLATLYSTTTFLNTTEETLTELTVGSGVTPDHLYVDGDEVAFVPAGVKKLADGGEVESYDFRLNRPVKPGAYVTELMVVQPTSGGIAARQVGDGRFRLLCQQSPGTAEEFVYVQAIRLPAGAKLLTADPPPDETRGDGAITLVWRRVLPPMQFFACTVEYLCEETGGTA